jgi:hypothetical protein
MNGDAPNSHVILHTLLPGDPGHSLDQPDYTCVWWCQIFSPLKLCAVSSSTDLYIMKETTLVGFYGCCLIGSYLGGENFYEFTWGSTHRDACTSRGATWHDTIWSWNQVRFVTTKELTDGAGCNAITASTQLTSILKMSACDRKLWQPANLRTLSTTKIDTS